MSTYFAYAKGTGKKNNGGTIRYGGNANTNYPGYGVWGVTNVPALSEFAYNPGQYSSIVPVNCTGAGTSAALSNGTFAKMSKGNYIFRAYMTTQIAGLASSLLASPAADYGRQSIHYGQTYRYWDLYSWQWTSNQDGGPTIATVINTGITPLATDSGAVPTRSLPGQLVYRNGSPLPYQDNYKPKTD